MTANSGIRCIKLSLILFTAIFIMTGFSLMIIGTTVDQIFVEFSHFFKTSYFSPSFLLCGLMTFGVACFGCVGAVKESVFMTMTFGLLLGVTSFLQLVAGVTNNLLMRDLYKDIEFNMNKTMTLYNRGDEQYYMDKLQIELHCCGLNGPEDWALPLYGNISIPDSCCSHFTVGHCDSNFNSGCYFVLKSFLQNSSRILSVSAYLLAFTQIFGMLFALYLGKILREQKIARNYRQWAIRNQLLNNITYDSFHIPFNPFYNENAEKDNTAKQCIFQ